jgi:hypothetical protein
VSVVRPRRRARTRLARALAALACVVAVCACVVALGGCGDTLQDKPIPHNILESLLVSPFPVYWLGASFHGLAVTEASNDPSGGFNLQYGNCHEGGQGTCVAPLRVITSADNSFLPGEAAPSHRTVIRGVPALVAEAGRTIVIPTGSVVVDIYARDSGLARAAARTVVPINEPGAPFAPLPAARPDSGYGSTPLPSQEPTPLRPLR